MSNSQSAAPAPVIWPLVVAMLGVFAIFLVIVNLARTPVTPLTAVVNVPEDQQWRLDSEGRQERRTELEAKARAQLENRDYRWINEADGIVALPLDRAIELTVADLNPRR